MKTSQALLYDITTGNIQYIEKNRFVQELAKAIKNRANKPLEVKEFIQLNNLTYKDITKLYENKGLNKLSAGIYNVKLSNNTLMIELIDKTSEDFEKYCKKNKWKFGKEVRELEPNSSIINNEVEDPLSYKPKESKEELKKMSKNILKRAAVASLAALVTIPNITIPEKVYASVASSEINGEYTGSCINLPLSSIIPVGNGLCQVIDAWGDTFIAYQNEVQEYQQIVASGQGHNLELVSAYPVQYVNQKEHISIYTYKIKGQEFVNFSQDKEIAMKDKYTFGPLLVEKYLSGGSVDQSTAAKSWQMLQNTLKEEKERALDAIEQQKQLNAEMEIERQMNMESINSLGQKTDLPYSLDYMYNYKLQVINDSHNKIWASFDNERNYVQQWMTKHGFNSMEELANTTGKEYIDQRNAAKVYLRDISNGTLPPNCSYGDWIRHNLKKSLMGGWNGLAMWRDGQLLDFSVIVANAMGKLITYEDETNANRQLYEWKLADLPVIASQPDLNLEQKNQMFEYLTGSNTWIECISTTKLCKKAYNSYVSSGEFVDMFKSEWDKLNK